MLFAIKLASDPNVRFVKSSGGYQNTAWSRIEIELDGLGDEGSLPRMSETPVGGDGVESVEEDEKKGVTEFDAPPAPSEAASSSTLDSSTLDDPRPPLPPQFAALLPTLPPIPPRDPSLPPIPNLAKEDPIPRIRFRVMAFNQSQHLVGLKRTRGGVGSGEWDEKQRGLKEFFAGGGVGGGGSPGKKAK